MIFKTISALSPNTLFNPRETFAESRTNSSLAFEAAFYPRDSIGAQHRVVYHYDFAVKKAELLTMLNEDMNILEVPMPGKLCPYFPIAWEYNNMPSAREWENLSYRAVISVTLRISPIIADRITSNLNFSGRVALLKIYPNQYALEKCYDSREPVRNYPIPAPFTF
jgi:hypothetical protein